MERLPFNPALETTPLSVFEGIIRQAKASKAERVIPLHQGKTAFTTPVGLREWRDGEFEYPAHHDGPTSGTSALLSAVRAKLCEQHHCNIELARLTITSGITHALSIAFHCILTPGDEVIVLSPQWLFVTGLVRAAAGIPIEVPIFPTRVGEARSEMLSRIESHVTPRTRAIYFNTPNNPTGYCLSREELSSLAKFARERGLWLVSDNAYEYYDFTDSGFVDIGTLEAARELTFSAYSFSKSYGLTGYRIGYLVAPPSMAERSRKFGLHSIYSVPTVCQFVALNALRAGPGVISSNASFVREALALTVKHLTVPTIAPSGGFYAFLDLSEWPSGVDDFVARCIAAGVSLAPGYVFGKAYRTFARLCFSVVGHSDLERGVRLINDVYQTGSSSLARPAADLRYP